MSEEQVQEQVEAVEQVEGAEEAPAQETGEFVTDFDRLFSMGEAQEAQEAQEAEEVAEEGETEEGELETELQKELGASPQQDAQLKALQQEVRTLNAQLAKMASTPQQLPELQAPALNEDEYIETIQTPEKFNAFIKQVYAKSVADARELILKESGSYILPQVRQQVKLQILAEQFFTRNPHLAGNRAEVARLAEHYENQNPGVSPEDIFSKLDEFAKRVGSNKKAAPKGMASTGGARKPAPRKVAQAEQDLLDLF